MHEKRTLGSLPDALEAFKRYGVANIKDLRVELMYSYVHQDMIPKLLSKAEQNGLFDDDGDDVCISNVTVIGGGASTTKSDINNKEVEISPSIAHQSPKDNFLKTYGLRTLGITTINVCRRLLIQEEGKALLCRWSRKTRDACVPTSAYK